MTRLLYSMRLKAFPKETQGVKAIYFLSRGGGEDAKRRLRVKHASEVIQRAREALPNDSYVKKYGPQAMALLQQ